MLTVITPVYNNRAYIERCIASAHAYSIVNEIIVVEDGGTDGTYELLLDLQEKYHKLTVITHPGRINQGIAKSRNLAIRHVKTDWISFLDSDDYYLDGRFLRIEKLIINPGIDGFFEPVVNQVISTAGSARFKQETPLHGKIIAIKDGSLSAFEAMYYGHGGVVHLNGLTLRRSLALRVGLFDEALRIVDDSVFRLKVTYLGKFERGSEQPIAVRTIHDTNSEPNITAFDVFMKHKVLLDFFLKEKAPAGLRRVAIRKLLYSYLTLKKSIGIGRIITAGNYLLKNPKVILAYI